MQAPLYEEIGRIKVEWDGLKKSHERVGRGPTRLETNWLGRAGCADATASGGVRISAGPTDILARGPTRERGATRPTGRWPGRVA